MAGKTISTVPRFIYLNAYAFLLMFMGIGIALIPLYNISLWFVAMQAIAFYVCEKNAFRIFRSWKDKKRKYRLLMERNSTEFRPETFSEYIQAPCGRLLVKIVLKDMNESGRYGSLLKMKKPFKENLKAGCRPVKTTVYIREEKS